MIFTIGEVVPDFTVLWWVGLGFFFIISVFIVGLWLEEEAIFGPAIVVGTLAMVVGVPWVLSVSVPDTVNIRTDQAKVSGMESIGFENVDLSEDDTFIARKGNDYYRGTLLGLGDRTYQVVELKEIK